MVINIKVEKNTWQRKEKGSPGNRGIIILEKNAKEVHTKEVYSLKTQRSGENELHISRQGEFQEEAAASSKVLRQEHVWDTQEPAGKLVWLLQGGERG